MNPYEITEILKKNGLRIGAMLSHSKSDYLDNHVGHEVYFNANIFVDCEKIWWGDIDLTLSGHILDTISKDCEKTIYVLSEFDGRIGTPSQSQITRDSKKTFAPPVKQKKSFFSSILSTKLLADALSAIKKTNR